MNSYKKMAVGAAFAAICVTALAQQESTKISPTAEDFVVRGMDTTLAGCSKPLPPKKCSYGRLIRKGPLESLYSTNNEGFFDYQELEFDGLSLTYRDGEIVVATVKNTNWPVSRGLRVGTSRNTLLRVLGTPSIIESSSRGEVENLRYCTESIPDCATFTINTKNGQVIEINWSKYYD
jgi:hypothetical protein